MGRAVRIRTAGAPGRVDTAVRKTTRGKPVSNARIERMVRELNADPPVQFFQKLFGLVGLGESPQRAAPTGEPARLARELAFRTQCFRPTFAFEPPGRPALNPPSRG